MTCEYRATRELLIYDIIDLASALEREPEFVTDLSEVCINVNAGYRKISSKETLPHQSSAIP